MSVLPVETSAKSILAVLHQETRVSREYFLGAEVATTRAQEMIRDLLAQMASASLSMLIDRTYPLAEAAAAHAYIESRQAVGRVILIP